MSRNWALRLIVAVATLFALCGATEAGFAEGEAAYVRGDYPMALREFRTLVDQGNAGAQNNLGNMYANGQGVPKDDGQAVLWFRKSADQGNAGAQFNLGIMYATGRGVPKDDGQAVLWYRKSADQGNAGAQNNLGIMYATGRGVPKDDGQAVLWYRKSADQGNAGAQHTLGIMYAAGRGVPKDEQQAVRWYRKSAAQGRARAQYGLGLSFEFGVGVPRDEQQAYFWYLLASAQGDETAKLRRDVVEAKLTVNQRSAAQAEARSWQPTAPGQTTSGGSDGGTAEGRKTPSATTSPQGPESTGSGWAVSSTQILTNAHVVAGCSRVAVAGRANARVQSVDGKSDLALLAVPDNPSTASLRTGRLRQGDAVTVVGYPLRGVLASGANVTTGNVSALAGLQNDSRFIQISAPVQPGNSGGPLLDSSGNVVGVVVSKLDAVKVAQLTGDIPQNVNFAVSLFTLQGFLEANAVDYQTAPSVKNLSTADVAEIGKRFTVLVECYK